MSDKLSTRIAALEGPCREIDKEIAITFSDMISAGISVDVIVSKDLKRSIAVPFYTRDGTAIL